jgi:hypothetical protein
MRMASMRLRPPTVQPWQVDVQHRDVRLGSQRGLRDPVAAPARYRCSVLPPTDISLVRRWVAARNDQIPEHASAHVRFELDVDDRTVTLHECRPPWQPAGDAEWSRFPIVRFRYTKASREWTTYWRDRNLRFHRYSPIEPSERIEELLAAVEQDNSGIFFG